MTEEELREDGEGQSLQDSDMDLDLSQALDEMMNILPASEVNPRLETIDVMDMAAGDIDIETVSRRNIFPTRTALPTPDQNETRPYDLLGAAAKPLSFECPKFARGVRKSVLCYNAISGREEVVSNVLLRDGDGDVKRGYWRIPHKETITTIMGHVEICRVLELYQDESDEDDDSYEDEENNQELVFQWTDEFVAVKVNSIDRMEQLRNRHAEDPYKEIAAMQLIGNDHPNVLGVQDVLYDSFGKNLNVVMRYLRSGDLFQVLQDHQGGGMSEGQVRFWFSQVMEGVKYLHSKGVCHRDLSPENIMIDRDGCLIIDMGMCLRVPYINENNEIVDVTRGSRRCLFQPQGACGKLPYMCPEIYRNSDNFDGQAADIWTAGTILFCMVTGNRSYKLPHPSDPQFYWMTRGMEQLLSDWQVNFSQEGRHLLQNMLQIEPRLRLTLDEVLNHPWFQLPVEPMVILS